MKSKEQVEKRLDTIAEKLQHFLYLPRNSEIQKEISYDRGYRDALQWILKE
jgi:hypothetical protein